MTATATVTDYYPTFSMNSEIKVCNSLDRVSCWPLKWRRQDRARGISVAARFPEVGMWGWGVSVCFTPTHDRGFLCFLLHKPKQEVVSKSEDAPMQASLPVHDYTEISFDKGDSFAQSLLIQIAQESSRQDRFVHRSKMPLRRNSSAWTNRGKYCTVVVRVSIDPVSHGVPLLAIIVK